MWFWITRVINQLVTTLLPLTVRPAILLMENCLVALFLETLRWVRPRTILNIAIDYLGMDDEYKPKGVLLETSNNCYGV
ncbi:hypothetical protein BDF19DRAFT_458468 [Syncephalis fuscata]|nr:hypothetical protein BDF19DRAFT_458468 [Syncephalis fuscata]